MNDNKQSFWQKWLQPNEEEKKRKKFNPKIIVLLLIAGILLMFSGSLFQSKPQEAPVFRTDPEEPKDVAAFAQKSTSGSAIEKYEKQYEEDLQALLEGMQGVKDVTVIVNLDSTAVKVLEKERINRHQKTNETDRDGGTRTVEDESVEERPKTIRVGDKEEPIVLKEDKPPVRGVAITAKGADNIEVKKAMIEMVTRYLDVPSHRVSVAPKKS
ncbi:stage III sporulation protein AG [Ectobacillus sp. JY-23]|uniref:stage III sporulation protein AG n=1 Tax=Ectobacillus sp. JY-23 TaxID=2933872 RepID=UPI001FF46A69|nr:stage III sporulation protein AG [Ectobacillus sp. JY-23]UOY93955.1 stage III sporulation protein AG [Ectobacillus sp. JY-23]